MLICENDNDGKTRKDKFGRNGFTALCPKHVSDVGKSGRNRRAKPEF